jgi:Tn7-like transposition protein D/TniQ
LIGFFTDPLPDETLYSACARYGDRLGFPNRARATEQLFGSKYAIAAVDFPSGLDHLISVLPQGHAHTSDQLIDNNTHFPYFAPFVPAERLMVLRREMRDREASYIPTRLGFNVGKLKPPEMLRFCPACVSDDRKKGRETYWRRIHQLTGVDTCPEHQVFLKSSSVPFLNSKRRGMLVSAESAASEAAVRHLNPAGRYDKVRHKIATNARWLLDWHGPYPGSESLRDCYYNYLLRRGFAYYNGRIRINKFVNAFTSFYSPKFLAEINCSLEESRMNWLLRLVRHSKSMAAQSPLHHILLMIFLGCTAEDLFTGCEEFKPFGSGPWPCLNRVADHYGELTVTECRVTDSSSKKKRGQPKGDFFCDCGFAYTRIGPDTSAEDRHRFDSVLSYGNIWEKTFEKQWRSRTITLTAMAKTFGVVTVTLQRHAIRLGLSVNRESPGSRPAKWVVKRYSRSRHTLTAARGKYRTKWLSMRKRNPGAGRKRLQTLAYYTWWWLSKNDRAWLENNSPESRRPNPQPTRPDWEKVDREVSVEVESAALQIMNADGKPVRISKAAIIAIVGYRGWIESGLSKLPRMSKVLERYLETREEFAVRLLIWTAEQFRVARIVPTRPQLIRRADLENRKASKSKIVQQKVDSLLREF